MRSAISQASIARWEERDQRDYARECQHGVTGLRGTRHGAPAHGSVNFARVAWQRAAGGEDGHAGVPNGT